MRVGLAQINTIVGDFPGNSAKVLEYLERARAADADLIAFPELTLCGYPPEDLVFRRDFRRACSDALQQIIPQVRDLIAIVGFVEEDQNSVYNSAAVIAEGRLIRIYRKHFLPNYGVFDELRYFTPGSEALLFTDGQLAFGVTICEDIWRPGGPVSALARAGAQLIVNISASPYEIEKGRQREALLSTRAAQEKTALALCNLVGGQDELIFDGQSLIYNAKGELLARARAFEEDLLIADLELRSNKTVRRSKSVTVIRLPKTLRAPQRVLTARIEPTLPDDEAIYRALVLATRDYLRKNGFQRALVGLSGGIDSSLVATVAADALGTENVMGVFLPSRLTSQESHEIVQQLARNLKIKLFVLEIDALYERALQTLAPIFAGAPADAAEENLQARLRALLWMALSNKLNALVLTAGNKSELSVGYATLYGDLAGGFAVLKDISKTRVYRLARWRNSQSPVIPPTALTRAPTAELRPHQTDEADLPLPYKNLDRVLEALIERNESVEQIADSLKIPKEAVRRVTALVAQSEYKRRQAPVGPKITRRAFGRDWRQPISQRSRF
ncbi:MAG: NAD+ synthase [Candidatus Bipolaricaulota bacterium]|nr:NAD+ synthase [Candidatus Bipolaricaulota bacterium]